MAQVLPSGLTQKIEKCKCNPSPYELTVGFWDRQDRQKGEGGPRGQNRYILKGFARRRRGAPCPLHPTPKSSSKDLKVQVYRCILNAQLIQKLICGAILILRRRKLIPMRFLASFLPPNLPMEESLHSIMQNYLAEFIRERFGVKITASFHTPLRINSKRTKFQGGLFSGILQSGLV